MKAEFWHQRWENNLTGFHLNEVNPHLKAHWPALQAKAGARVFVPLAGKTRDLLWLAEQGFEVVAIELSPLAVEQFFSENNLSAEKQQIHGMSCTRSGNISLFCGDFFDLTTDILGQVDAVYDRASLIALPPEMRQRYAQKLTELAHNAPKLLITLEYEQAKMDGPPFSVTEKEVQSLYQDKYRVTQRMAQDVLDESPRFREKGLDYMKECVYQLTALD
ncbi:MAG: thiopurine S-methyltransferase [Gammaproteobacteria bacterium]|nr:thiopurine S-methyltransferase [Gammaproteobacteria bacterium]